MMFCYSHGVGHNPAAHVSTTSSAPATSRLQALDALRGLAILLMVFSGRIPFGVLPDWMYHAQVPPPDHVFDPTIPGITWVDLVFPFFLFAMGAAMPFALQRRIDREDSIIRLSGYILLRGFLLAAFAIYVMHIRPWLFGDDPGAGAWLFALAGFMLLFPMFAALPSTWRRSVRAGIRTAGWAAAAMLMASARFADGSGFSVARSDIIILVLSNVAVVGAFLWLLTRMNHLLRLGLLGFLLALRLTHDEYGVGRLLWDMSPVPWLFQVRFLQYLFITIPGTIVGDFLLQWTNTRQNAPPTGEWSTTRYAWIAGWMILANILIVIGLKERLVVETTILMSALCLLLLVAMLHPHHPTETLLRRLSLWGVFLLLLGLALEPFEGGIKKDHATLSYYFVTTGLAIFTLIALLIVLDIFRWRRGFALLIRTGQNPLIAYAGVNSLVPPVLGLTRLDIILTMITPSPWLGALRGAFHTYLVALAAAFCTRKKIFLKT